MLNFNKYFKREISRLSDSEIMSVLSRFIKKKISRLPVTSFCQISGKFRQNENLAAGGLLNYGQSLRYWAFIIILPNEANVP